jgi:hypothetical protein
VFRSLQSHLGLFLGTERKTYLWHRVRGRFCDLPVCVGIVKTLCYKPKVAGSIPGKVILCFSFQFT